MHASSLKPFAGKNEVKAPYMATVDTKTTTRSKMFHASCKFGFRFSFKFRFRLSSRSKMLHACCKFGACSQVKAQGASARAHAACMPCTTRAIAVHTCYACRISFLEKVEKPVGGEIDDELGQEEVVEHHLQHVEYLMPFAKS